MTHLVEALDALGIEGEVSSFGRWVSFQGEHGRVFVVEGARGNAYYTWCEEPAARAVEAYPTPTAAIQAGLRRAADRPGGASRRRDDARE